MKVPTTSVTLLRCVELKSFRPSNLHVVRTERGLGLRAIKYRSELLDSALQGILMRLLPLIVKVPILWIHIRRKNQMSRIERDLAPFGRHH